MSRIGKQPILVPSTVTITIRETSVEVKGPKGTLLVNYNPILKVTLDANVLLVERTVENDQQKKLHGLTRTLISNAVVGVTEGFKKKLEVQGVGFKVAMQGNDFNLALGFSHPVIFKCPENLKFSLDTETKNVFVIEGCDKIAVGETAAKIRLLKKPEPYKGKGIRYLGEFVRRKAGKSAGK